MYNKLKDTAVPRSIDTAHWFFQHEFFYFTILSPHLDMPPQQ